MDAVRQVFFLIRHPDLLKSKLFLRGLSVHDHFHSGLLILVDSDVGGGRPKSFAQEFGNQLDFGGPHILQSAS